MRRLAFALLLGFPVSNLTCAQSRSGTATSGTSSTSAYGNVSSGYHSSYAGGSSSSGKSSFSRSPASSNPGNTRSVWSAEANDVAKPRADELHSRTLKPGLQPRNDKPSSEKVTGKSHNWLSRLFAGKGARPEVNLRRPCLGKNCPPPPPKPCTGQQCAARPPRCELGTIPNDHGGCTAARYASVICAIHPEVSGYPLVDNSSCAAFRAQFNAAILDRDRLLEALNKACASDARSAQCISLTDSCNASQVRVKELRLRAGGCLP
jgi:hypothetical protein